MPNVTAMTGTSRRVRAWFEQTGGLSHGFWLSRLFYCSGSFEPASRWRGEPNKAYVELQADETSAT